MTEVTFNRWKCYIEFGTYPNGRIAIDLNHRKTGELVAVATVNVPEQFVPKGHVLIKDYSENAGMFKQLQEQGIVGPQISKVRVSQFTDDVILCRLLIEPS
jgi:hypothetical protein